MKEKKKNSRCQEISIVFASDLSGKVLRSKMELVALGSLCGKAIGTLVQEFEGIGLVDTLAFGGGDAVLDPLPQLASRDFGGGSVLPDCVDLLISHVVLINKSQ